MLAKPSSLCHKKAVSTLILAGLYMKNRKGTSFDPDDGFLLPPEERAIRRSPEEQKERELRRRRLELTAALITVLVVVVSSWWQLSYLEGDSWLFLVLLNINIILMLVVLFLVSSRSSALMRSDSRQPRPVRSASSAAPTVPRRST